MRIRYLLGLLGIALVFFLSAGPLDAQTKRAAVGYTLEQKAGKTTITITYDDGLVVVLQPVTGQKQAAVIDMLDLLGLAGVKLPSLAAPAATAVPPASKQTKADAPASLEGVKSAVAAIINEAGKSAGSAVLVGPDKLLTTASLGDAKKLRLRFPGGAELPADVVGSDKGVSFLSVIAASTGKREPIPFGTSDGFKTGFVVGSPYSPDEAVQTVEPTAVNQTVTSFKGMMKLSRELKLAAAGSAVVDANGKLVALVCAWPSLEGTWALPVEQIETAMKGGQ